MDEGQKMRGILNDDLAVDGYNNNNAKLIIYLMLIGFCFLEN